MRVTNALYRHWTAKSLSAAILLTTLHPLSGLYAGDEHSAKVKTIEKGQARDIVEKKNSNKTAVTNGDISKVVDQMGVDKDKIEGFVIEAVPLGRFPKASENKSTPAADDTSLRDIFFGKGHKEGTTTKPSNDTHANHEERTTTTDRTSNDKTSNDTTAADDSAIDRRVIGSRTSIDTRAVDDRGPRSAGSNKVELSYDSIIKAIFGVPNADEIANALKGKNLSLDEIRDILRDHHVPENLIDDLALSIWSRARNPRAWDDLRSEFESRIRDHNSDNSSRDRDSANGLPRIRGDYHGDFGGGSSGDWGGGGISGSLRGDISFDAYLNANRGILSDAEADALARSMTRFMDARLLPNEGGSSRFRGELDVNDPRVRAMIEKLRARGINPEDWFRDQGYSLHYDGDFRGGNRGADDGRGSKGDYRGSYSDDLWSPFNGRYGRDGRSSLRSDIDIRGTHGTGAGGGGSGDFRGRFTDTNIGGDRRDGGNFKFDSSISGGGIQRTGKFNDRGMELVNINGKYYWVKFEGDVPKYAEFEGKPVSISEIFNGTGAVAKSSTNPNSNPTSNAEFRSRSNFVNIDVSPQLKDALNAMKYFEGRAQELGWKNIRVEGVIGSGENKDNVREYRVFTPEGKDQPLDDYYHQLKKK